MNNRLRDFIKNNYQEAGTALDLGAGDFFDVACLNQLGWKCVGVDKNMGIDLENPYLSPLAPFDLVFSNYVIHKLENQQQLIKTAFENLKDGGRLFIHTFDESDPLSKRGLNKEYIVKLLIDNEFKNIETSVIDFYDNEEGHKHWHKILEVTAVR